MAFATSNVQTDYTGRLQITYGDFTCLAGDPPGTITVKGGRVLLCKFQDQDPGTPQQTVFLFSTTQSGATTTITVYCNEPVVTGRFVIMSA